MTAANSIEKYYNTLLAPIITEKTTMGGENNQFVFRVPLTATKPEISEAVEALFKVKVKAVNTIRNKGKMKVFRGHRYTRSTVKKAIITLEDGHTIDITTGL